MSEDTHIRCNIKITMEDVMRDNENSPLLKKLWEDAEVELSIPNRPYVNNEDYYDNVRDLFPKIRSNFYLNNTLLAIIPKGTIGDHDKVYLTLKWFAEYLRQLVKRTGEVWYTENWVSGDYLEREDLKVVTYDVNEEICFMKYEDKEFRFATDTFYRFVDGNEKK